MTNIRDLLTQEKYKTWKRNTVQSNPLFRSLKMEAVHRTALRKSCCDIIDMLLNDTSKLDSILDYLSVNVHIFTDSMLEEIQSERTYRSRIRRSLDIIPKRGPHADYLFLNCLKEHGYDTLRTLIIANESTNEYYQQQRKYMPFYNLSQQKQNVDAQINQWLRTSRMSNLFCRRKIILF